MEFDPLELADTMRESYAEHYAGSATLAGDQESLSPATTMGVESP